MVFSFLGRHPGASGSGSGSGTPLRGPAEVRAYWEGLRQNGAIPSRADLDPRGMASVLDQVFVAERIGTGLLRLRIAGTALTDLAGIEMKGMPLSALFLPMARQPLADLVESVLTRPQTAELHLLAEHGIGRPALAGRLLLLPLRARDGARNLVLGCLATEGDIGRGPRRFDITRADQAPLTQTAPALPPSLSPAFAEPPAAPFAARPTPPSRRPVAGRAHLRLVHSVG